MNIWLLSSGLLAILGGIAHGYLGEKNILSSLLSEENAKGVLKPKVTRNILRGVWHLPAASWAIMGLMTIYYSFSPSPPTVPILVAILVYLVGMFTNLIATKGKHIGWPLLLFISLLAAVGLYV